MIKNIFWSVLLNIFPRTVTNQTSLYRFMKIKQHINKGFMNHNVFNIFIAM